MYGAHTWGPDMAALMKLDYPDQEVIEMRNTANVTVLDDHYHTGYGVFPRVNKILKDTMPAEKKQKLAAWAVKQKAAWLRAHRSCKNCQHYSPDPLSCFQGEKVRAPDLKNRCKEFEILPEFIYDPRSGALARGIKIHDAIEQFFKRQRKQV